MKISWQTKKLGEICDVVYGTRVVRKRDGGTIYPVYGGGGKTFFLDKFNRENCMVIARFAMSKQCTRFIKGKFFLNDSGLTVTPKNQSVISQDFLDVQLFFLNDYIYSLAKGAAQKNLDVPAFREMTISFPELLTEQKRIVKILDEVFGNIEKAKENTQKNLQNSKDLFESYLQSVFAYPEKDWEAKRLGECFKLKSGDNITSKMMVETGKYPVYGGNGIVGMYDKFNLSGSNIIIGRVGALCGRVRHIVKNIWLTDNGFKVVDYGFDFDHDFLTYLLNFKDLRNFARQAAQPVISNSSLENVWLQFPNSKEEQEAIVKKLDELSEQTKKLEENYKQKLLLLDELKKSVLAKAFNGEL